MQLVKLFAYTTVMVVCAALFVLFAAAPDSVRQMMAGSASIRVAWAFYSACVVISGVAWIHFIEKFLRG